MEHEGDLKAGKYHDSETKTFPIAGPRYII